MIPNMEWIIMAGMMSLFAMTAGETKHCYVCKSRGDTGDCKDPYNSESGAIPPQSIQPCFTGWCMKTLDTDDNFPATQRTCMNSPPDDNTPRCTYAMDNLPGFAKKVYVCYCKGNLCNSALSGKASTRIVISAAFVVFLFFTAGL
ncbi:hypothetical protein BV898_08117 [Hypsibius exemplaris]|uniref:Protein sleepless n=1 Tax=Hypsibius exemplaris TaxID=2072580 RepID=A0A1W0WRI5_HYPEX|nr:hypothetical protein BV898_08117 [Hypsibius exemplaris]